MLVPDSSSLIPIMANQIHKSWNPTGFDAPLCSFFSDRHAEFLSRRCSLTADQIKAFYLQGGNETDESTDLQFLPEQVSCSVSWLWKSRLLCTAEAPS